MNLNIAGNLKRLRRKRNLTQDELAGFLGTSFQAISKWERGDGYPDITFLPVLANFFDVSIDELVGMNEIRSGKRIQEIHAQWKENNANGKNAENILLMREALRTYPNDFVLMAQLVTSLEKCEAAPAENARNRAEAIEISERIVAYCPDADIRNAFLFNICYSYWKNGDMEQAVKRARQLPSIYKTQENALVMFLKGEEKIQVGQRAVTALVISLFQQILSMTDGAYYSPNEKISILGKCCEVSDILFENDDMPAILRYKASAYRKMADLVLEQHENEAAIHYLKSAVENADKSIHLQQQPTSLLANDMEAEPVSSSLIHKLGMQELLSDEKYAPLRSDSRFTELCERIGRTMSHTSSAAGTQKS